jgi:hypothetical protein
VDVFSVRPVLPASLGAWAGVRAGAGGRLFCWAPSTPQFRRPAREVRGLLPKPRVQGAGLTGPKGCMRGKVAVALLPLSPKWYRTC